MVLKTIIFLFLNFAALALGSLFTSVEVKSEWYSLLNKAPWTPAGWVFGFAWTSIMICYAFYMSYLWTTRQDKETLILLYSIQWVLNVAWNPIFFKFHYTNFALIVIVLLTLLIGYFLYRFLGDLRFKSLLIMPYFLWLLIATSLNAYICLKN